MIRAWLRCAAHDFGITLEGITILQPIRTDDRAPLLLNLNHNDTARRALLEHPAAWTHLSTAVEKACLEHQRA